MLREIYIKNFILIEELRMGFTSGLNVLTGETGAGKSIVVEALELLIGERISSEMVRDPREKSVVEGVFDVEPGSALAEFLSENNLLEPGDDLLIIRREISGGRVTNRVNEKTVNASVLKNISEYVIDIHLQHESQRILDPKIHIHLIDAFSPDIKRELSHLAQLYQRWKSIDQELAELTALESQRVQEIEFLEYQIKEIEAAALTEGEDEELYQQRNRMMNAEKLGRAAAQVKEYMYDGRNAAVDQIAAALDTLKTIDDPVLAQLEQALNDAYYLMEEQKHILGKLINELDFDPNNLELIEERLQLINRLKKKYGPTIKDIQSSWSDMKDKLSKLNEVDHRIQQLQADRENLSILYHEKAAAITGMRQKTAALLEAQVSTYLKDLAMPDVTFCIKINPSPPAPNGVDEVLFLFSANLGEEPRLLTKVASGGELSRFVLALKTALAGAYQVPTMVFDEIDIGIGGQALQAVGQKLQQLSRAHQVILITHSPQVACRADNHMKLNKIVENNRTLIEAHSLNYEQKVEEISRMLAGENVTAAVLEHARQMLKETCDNG